MCIRDRIYTARGACLCVQTYFLCVSELPFRQVYRRIIKYLIKFTHNKIRIANQEVPLRDVQIEHVWIQLYYDK